GNRGTDHGHANSMFVMGGDVKGGKVYGKWPGLEHEQLYEGRDLALTADFRDVLGELVARHIGTRTVKSVFPGYDPNFIRLLAYLLQLDGPRLLVRAHVTENYLVAGREPAANLDSVHRRLPVHHRHGNSMLAIWFDTVERPRALRTAEDRPTDHDHVWHSPNQNRRIDLERWTPCAGRKSGRGDRHSDRAGSGLRADSADLPVQKLVSAIVDRYFLTGLQVARLCLSDPHLGEIRTQKLAQPAHLNLKIAASDGIGPDLITRDDGGGLILRTRSHRESGDPGGDERAQRPDRCGAGQGALCSAGLE